MKPDSLLYAVSLSDAARPTDRIVWQGQPAGRVGMASYLTARMEQNNERIGTASAFLPGGLPLLPA